MKKGFTLVELLAVVVIIGLLMTIAIPAVLKVSNNVKEESYEAKIKMITDAAISYGDVIKKTHLTNRVSEASSGSHTTTCENDPLPEQFVTSDGTCDQNGTYPAYRMTVKDLVEANELSYDETDRCKGNYENNCSKYDNVIKNPISGNIINNCFVYIYYKNNRIYAKFDRTTCDAVSDSANGHEFKDTLA